MAAAIVSVFETGGPVPKYDTLAILRDGPGNIPQVTFGSHQMTDASNSLDKCVRRIVDLATEVGDNSAFVKTLRAAIPILAKNTTSSIRSLASDTNFHIALKASAKTEYGKRAQREVYDELYVQPAVNACAGSGWVEPLSLAVVLDGMTHGSWRLIRDQVDPERPERYWIVSYLWRRRNFLKAHPRQLLKATACRPESLLRIATGIDDMKILQQMFMQGDFDALQRSFADGNPNLTTPLPIRMYGRRGVVTIQESDLHA